MFFNCALAILSLPAMLFNSALTCNLAVLRQLGLDMQLGNFEFTRHALALCLDMHIGNFRFARRLLRR